MYDLKVSGLAPGQSVQLDGIGELSNGKYTVLEEEAASFLAATEAYAGERTFIQAFKGSPMIEVSKTKADDKPADSKPAEDKKEEK